MARSGRHLARRCAVQALYQWRVTGQPRAQIEANFIANENLTGAHRAYFSALIRAVPEHIEEVDQLIAPHLDRDPERVDWIEQAILRLGAYELRHARDVPAKVVLDEAVELARLFCAEHGYKYVNGVLDKIARQVRGEGAGLADRGDETDAASAADAEDAGDEADAADAKDATD